MAIKATRDGHIKLPTKVASPLFGGGGGGACWRGYWPRVNINNLRLHGRTKPREHAKLATQQVANGNAKPAIEICKRSTDPSCVVKSKPVAPMWDDSH